MLGKMPEEYKGDYTKNGGYTSTKPRRWTDKELEWCIAKREEGYAVKDIANAVDRSEVSVGIKLKRATKKDNTYNKDHVDQKYRLNRAFIDYLQPKTVLDVYCGEYSFYKAEYPSLKTTSNDSDEAIVADYNEDSLKLLCMLYYNDNQFDLVDLDPFGSASECFDLAIKMAKKGLVITLGEMGHKRWKRLDYVSRHYGITSLEEFTTTNLINLIVEQGKKHKKLLVPHFYKEWQHISRVWFEIKPLKITEQWDK